MLVTQLFNIPFNKTQKKMWNFLIGLTIPDQQELDDKSRIRISWSKNAIDRGLAVEV
jgi:hypothetical protein